MKAKNQFWEKANSCNHKNLSPNYYKSLKCGTEYCLGGETHCLDCGVYILECGCGYLNCMSGRSDKWWNTLWNKPPILERT